MNLLESIDNLIIEDIIQEISSDIQHEHVPITSPNLTISPAFPNPKTPLPTNPSTNHTQDTLSNLVDHDRVPSPYKRATAFDQDGLSYPSIGISPLTLPKPTLTLFIGTRQRLLESPQLQDIRLQKMENAVKTLLECMGEDPNREGLLKTPNRFSKALLFFTKGTTSNLIYRL